MLTQTCKLTSKPFPVATAEVEAYQHFGLPIPDLCPEERCRRLLLFRNERHFFWRTCDRTAAKIYSAYAQTAPFPVIDTDYWWSDEFDATIFARKFSRRRSFFEQLFELWKRVPRPSTDSYTCFNVNAVHYAHGASNSAFLSDAYNVDNCYYGVGLWHCRACVDCLNGHHLERCYACAHCSQCNELRWGENCSGCIDSWFLSECHNCKNCLFCTNLRDKEYYIFNQQVTPEEYRKAVRDWNFTARPKVELAVEEFAAFLKTHPVPHIFADSFETNDGNYLRRCHNTSYSFQCTESSNIMHCHTLARATHCLEGYGGGEDLSEAAQFVSCGGQATRVVNSIACWGNVSDLDYCSHCSDSSNLIGCVGLRGREYCIFNMQYTPSEYAKVREKIVTKMKEQDIWGNFFPVIFSGHAYNRSAASDYMPLNYVQASMLRLPWDERVDDIRPSQLLGHGGDTIDTRLLDMPARLEELDLELVREQVFLCEMTGKPYQLTSAELQLYLELGVAPPSRSAEQRYRERLSRLTPKRVFTRTFADGVKLRSAFPQSWPRPVVPYQTWSEQTV